MLLQLRVSFKGAIEELFLPSNTFNQSRRLFWNLACPKYLPFDWGFGLSQSPFLVYLVLKPTQLLFFVHIRTTTQAEEENQTLIRPFQSSFSLPISPTARA